MTLALTSPPYRLRFGPFCYQLKDQHKWRDRWIDVDLFVTFGAILFCSDGSAFFSSIDLLFELIVLSSSLDRLFELGTLELDSRLFLFYAHDMKREVKVPKIQAVEATPGKRLLVERDLKKNKKRPVKCPAHAPSHHSTPTSPPKTTPFIYDKHPVL